MGAYGLRRAFLAKGDGKRVVRVKKVVVVGHGDTLLDGEKRRGGVNSVLAELIVFSVVCSYFWLNLSWWVQPMSCVFVKPSSISSRFLNRVQRMRSLVT